MKWDMPVTTQKADGEPRHVGIEIEFQGIAIDELVTLVHGALGGTVNKVSRSEYDLEVPGQGTWRIEVDYALLKEMAKEEAAEEENEEITAQSLAIDALDKVSSLLVPCEIVSPPLEMETIGAPMDAIVEAVRDGGGKGTRASVMYAFGVHFNVEPTDMQASTILDYMRAFVCLFDWIVWQGEIDMARRVTPYIKPFPREYQALILDPAYQPDFASLIADYLAHNPTRNRALDMLPLFSMIDEETIQTTVNDDRVNARPTFHYRLANSCVDEPEWSIADPWSRWVQIEKLTADKHALETLCAEMLTDSERMLHPLDNQWREKVQLWVKLSG